MDLQTAFKNLLIAAEEDFGPAEFKYRKVHHRWCSRSKSHSVACIDHPEVTREEFLKGFSEGREISSKAFFGKYKGSYYDYRQEVSKPGYLHKIKEMIEAEIKKEEAAPKENAENACHNTQQSTLCH